jgi:hypothetical protein
MTRTEQLLFHVAEECAEVAQRASKAARFGLTEVQTGQGLNNAERLMQEYADLVGVIELLVADGSLPPLDPRWNGAVEAKKKKVERYLEFSRQCGTLEGDSMGARQLPPLPDYDWQELNKATSIQVTLRNEGAAAFELLRLSTMYGLDWDKGSYLVNLTTGKVVVKVKRSTDRGPLTASEWAAIRNHGGVLGLAPGLEGELGPTPQLLEGK